MLKRRHTNRWGNDDSAMTPRCCESSIVDCVDFTINPTISVAMTVAMAESVSVSVAVATVSVATVEWVLVTVGVRIAVSVTQVSWFRNCHTDCNGQKQNDIL